MVSIIGYTYFGYPVVVSIFAYFFNKPIQFGSYTPTVALIVPAFNEESVIEAKIHNLLSLSYPKNKLNIIVASDGSTDSTNELVTRYKESGVKLIVSSLRNGKNGLLNSVIPNITEEIVVISDANIELASDSLSELISSFSDRNVGGAWADKEYRNRSKSAAGEGESLYLRYEKFIKSKETKLGSIVAGECSCLAFRRELFSSIPIDIPDDFALSTNVIAKGMRMVYVPSAKTYEDTSPTDKDEYHRKIRIIERAFRGFSYRLPLANPLKTGVYAVSLITRQLLRKGVALLFLALIIILPFLWSRGGIYVAANLVAIVVIALSIIGAIAHGGWRQLPVLYVPYYFVLVNIAALAGLFRFLRGEKSVKWQPTSRFEK